jgi:chromosome partitioning protein
MLGGKEAKPPTLAPVLLGSEEATHAIRTTATRGLYVLPSSPELAEANLELTNLIGRERRLTEALEPAEGEYDFVLIDTGPQRSLLSINALCYVSEVIIPVEPSLFSLSGLGQLQTAVEDVRRYLGNRELRILGLILSRVRRDAVSRDVEARLRADFGKLVFNATIPASVKVEEAHSRFASVIDYAPKSPPAVAFNELVGEVLSHAAKERNGRAARRSDSADDAA